MNNKELLKESKLKIENRINEILDKEIEKYKNNNFIKESILELKRLSQGGKRVRGYLIKLGNILFGKDDDDYLDMAAAFEIFQTAILIHDDIIDEADKRRGIPTINSLYEGHNGIVKAICVGDLGFFISYDILSNLNISDEIKTKISQIYAKTLYNTVNGEIIDTELPLKDRQYHINMDEEIIYEIYANKTAWYTIIGPLLIGANMAGINKKDEELLIEIGLKLGIAFQIKDDLLGLYSNSNVMGKTLNDIKENKQTIIYKYAINHANKNQLEFIDKYYGTNENNDKLIELFEEIGARKNAEDLVEQYTNDAIKVINKLNIDNKDLLVDFADYLLKREN